MRVIFGKGFVAINNPGKTVAVSLSPITNPKFELKDADDEDEEVANTFSSAPRFKRSISKKKITIEAPPMMSSGREKQAESVFNFLYEKETLRPELEKLLNE